MTFLRRRAPYSSWRWTIQRDRRATDQLVHADSINFKETHMLAYDYPLLGLFWTMMIFFLWVAWLILLFRVFGDIFRSKDMGGFAKAIWSIFVILVPFLGVFLYVIVNGRAMSERDVADAKEREAEFQAYVRETAGTAGSAEEIAKLADLRDRGVISDEEFATSKAKLLA